MNSGGSNQDGDDEMPSLSIAQWEPLMARTARELLAGLDAWRADDARREAFLLARIKAGRQLNQTSKSC
jgi:hypothetical protein